MAKPYWMDLRERAMRRIDAGESVGLGSRAWVAEDAFTLRGLVGEQRSAASNGLPDGASAVTRL